MATKLHDLKQQLFVLKKNSKEISPRDEIGERNPPSAGDHLNVARRGMSTTYGPTPLHMQNLEIAKTMMASLYTEISSIGNTTIPQLEKELKAMGAPYILGQGID